MLRETYCNPSPACDGKVHVMPLQNARHILVCKRLVDLFSLGQFELWADCGQTDRCDTDILSKKK